MLADQRGLVGATTRWTLWVEVTTREHCGQDPGELSSHWEQEGYQEELDRCPDWSRSRAVSVGAAEKEKFCWQAFMLCQL